MPNYNWSNNKKYRSSGYGLWEITSKKPAGFYEIHVTMNYPEHTTSVVTTWPHITMIDDFGHTTHVYIKREEGKAIISLALQKKLGSATSNRIELDPDGKAICQKVVSDFREWGIPCEYLGIEDHTRKNF
jgi:hypothetical protein